MAGKAKYDWDTIRRTFVSGDMDLRSLSRAHTNLLTSPTYDALLHKASKEHWTEQRQTFKHNLNIQTVQQPTAKQVIERTQSLVDAAETISRHIRIAKSLQAKALERLRTLNPEQMSPKDTLEYLKAATEIERRAMLLPEPQQQIDLNIDLTRLSDEELELHRQIMLKTLKPASGNGHAQR